MPEPGGSGPPTITVVGLDGDDLGPGAAGHEALGGAVLVVGGRRHHASTSHLNPDARRVALEDGLDAALDAIAAETGPVCVLASGDPGFFGIGRALAGRFGAHRLTVHPAPSSVSLAFARLGLPWDDALVVSAHGRPLDEAARMAARATKAAVLTSPDSPPEALGAELVSLGAHHRTAAVCSLLGLAGEVVTVTDLHGLAGGTWAPLSVVVLLGPEQDLERGPSLAWGQGADAFAHRDAMITKGEVRAVALGKLSLPTTGVLWDVGAGSGSVAVECARLAPLLRVVAVERDPDAARMVSANATAHGVTVDVVVGEAPGVLASLDSPDRAFVGGGGPAVLDAVLARLAPGGTVVATYAALDRAAAAFERLGNLVELSVNRGCPLPGGGVRLTGDNPVFLAWGPSGPPSGVTGPSGPPSGVTGPSGPPSGVTGPSGPPSGVTGPSGPPSGGSQVPCSGSRG